MTFKKFARNTFRFFLYVFALIGLLFVGVFIFMQFGWLNVKGSVSERNSYFKINKVDSIYYDEPISNEYVSSYDWVNTDEWRLMKEVFTRDQDIIKRAASDAGVSPRIIIACVAGEQFRFFGNSRESFKSYFEPMKILASLSKISFGIAGLKPKTIIQIESNLKNANSPFYLGEDMEGVTGTTGEITEEEIMTRITNVKDPYYSYLYVGLYAKQITTQWNRAGYDISEKAGIIATLYNLGFYYSHPKENPEIGGAVIKISDKDYSFGDIGHEFYFSRELSEIFPI